MILTNSRMTQSELWRRNTRTVAVSNRPGAEFLEAWRLFEGRRAHEGVVVLGARVALCYAILCRLFGKGVPYLVKEMLIGDEFRSGLKRRVQGWAFRDCNVLALYSESERRQCVDSLRLQEDQCVFLPFHTRRDPAPAPIPGNGVILCAGRSVRDYATLARAIRDVDADFEIVAPRSEAVHFKGLGRVKWLGELPDAEYRARLEACSAVAITLHPTARSAGQAVLLEAMALGKPAVVADVPALRDYIVPEVTTLLYVPGDAGDLRRQLARLSGDPALREGLGRASWERATRLYSPEQHARSVLELVRGMRA